MSDPVQETFEEAAARIAREPTHIEVKVTPITIDLSPTGVLARLNTMVELAHERGEIQTDQLKEIVQAADVLKTKLARVDHKVLLRAASSGQLRR